MSRRELAAALLLNCVFWVFQTWPVVLHPMTSISGSQGDATGSIYDMWNANHTGHLVISRYVNGLLGWPFGIPVNGTMNYSAAMVVVPAQMISRISNEFFAYNFLMFLGLTLPGYLTYIFLRTRGHRVGVSTFGALAFTLFPFHLVSAAGWTTLAQTWVIPLGFIVLDRFRNDPSWVRFGHICAAVLVSVTTNGYLGLMVCVAVSTSLLFDLTDLRVRKWLASQYRLRMVQVLTGISTLVLLLAIPEVLKVVRGTVKRDVSELTTYGLRFSELVRPGPFRRFAPHLYDKLVLHDGHGSNMAELSQFVGYSVLVLAILGIVRLLKGRAHRELSRSVLLLLVLLWCAMSQGLVILGISLPVPGEILLRIAPVWRVYSRFGVAIMFVLVVLAVSGTEYLTGLFHRSALRNLVLAICCIWAVVDLALVVPGGYSKFVTPEYVKFLGKKTGVVAMYPLSGYDDFLIYERRFWQRETQLPMINGDHGTDDYLISQNLEDYRVAEIGGRLAALGVKWVVVDRFRLGEGEGWVPKDPSLVQVWRNDKVSIFENRAKASTAITRFVAGAYGTENVGLPNQGNWIASTATIEVVGPENSCVSVPIQSQPYADQGPLHVSTGGPEKEVSGSFTVHVHLKGQIGHIVLSSPSGTTNIKGPDTREVSHYVEIGRSVVDGICGG